MRDKSISIAKGITIAPDNMTRRLAIIIPAYKATFLPAVFEPVSCTKTENKSMKCIVFIGDHTMEVLTWYFLSMKLVSLMLIATYDLPIKRLSEFPVIEEYTRQGWWIAYLVIGVGIPVIWTYYYHLFKDRLTKCSSDFV